MASTLLLDRSAWDLAIDARGNIAVATEPYAVIQDVASACRLFARELYYDTSKGLPYFMQILGRYKPTALLKAKLIDAALSVPGVVSAQVFLVSSRNREIRGQIQCVLSDGSRQTATL